MTQNTKHLSDAVDGRIPGTGAGGALVASLVVPDGVTVTRVAPTVNRIQICFRHEHFLKDSFWIRQLIKQKMLNVSYVLFCSFLVLLCLILSGPYFHSTLKLDSVSLVCNIFFFKHLFNLYYFKTPPWPVQSTKKWKGGLATVLC